MPFAEVDVVNVVLLIEHEDTDQTSLRAKEEPHFSQACLRAVSLEWSIFIRKRTIRNSTSSISASDTTTWRSVRDA